MSREIEPYNELEDIRPHRHSDEEDWYDDEDDEDDDQDPYLDPGFASWDDFNRYMYG